VARATVGELMRQWRTRRRRSQMDLSLDVGVSTRHLSFVETGRSRPSPELVLAVAEHLDVPLRERNRMLLAAGYAPRFGQRALDDPALERALGSLRRMLDAHDPYPGVVIDRRWDVLLANRAATRLVEGLPAHVVEPRLNVFRVCLHPDGLAAVTLDFGAWAAYLLRQIRRTVELTGDGELAALEQEVLAYPTVAHLDRVGVTDEGDDPPLLVPFRLAAPAGELSFFTTLTTFGTPQDVTLEELCVELFFPADDETERLLRA
jgi:transcriptional regulator with XRE-family HTH domain